jgi:hypothetical protein
MKRGSEGRVKHSGLVRAQRTWSARKNTLGMSLCFQTVPDLGL